MVVTPPLTARPMRSRTLAPTRVGAGNISTRPLARNRRLTTFSSRGRSNARYGQTSQSCLGPLLQLLIVQIPLDVWGFTQARSSPMATLRKGQRPPCWSARPFLATTGYTRWPNHSLMKLPCSDPLLPLRRGFPAIYRLRRDSTPSWAAFAKEHEMSNPMALLPVPTATASARPVPQNGSSTVPSGGHGARSVLRNGPCAGGGGGDRKERHWIRHLVFLRKGRPRRCRVPP